MENQIHQQPLNQNQIQTKFDLSHAILNINQQIDTKSEEELSIYQKLITDLNINARQKLKHYKKLLQSAQKQNLAKEKHFINKYLKRVFLQQYVFGTTSSKPALINLLKRLQMISYLDLITTVEGFNLKEFQQIKYFSEVVDLVHRQYKQVITNEEFQKLGFVMDILHELVLEGSDIIVSNEYKAKWLGTFTEVLRTENLLQRVFIAHLSQQMLNKVIVECRRMIKMAGCLSKEVVTQLHLLILYLNPNEPQPSPQNHLCLIHYYHALSVVKGTVNIVQLVSLIPQIKQTEHKCQLLPFLEQAFVQHYHKLDPKQYKDFRNNVFDQVINLFQVGRSIYSYLQTIVKIIIQSGDHWNLEGNFVRKFFTSTIVLKILPTKSIMQLWPTIVDDIIVQCGNMSVPYAFDCAKILFEKLFEQNNKNYNQWSLLWIDSYKKKLLDSNEKGSIRGIIEFINPILLKICPQPFLLKDLLTLTDNESSSNLQLGVISLIRCYKQIGQIEVNEKDQTFQHVLDKKITFSFNKIRNFLLSNDEMIAFQALQLVSCSLKPSQLVKPMQLKLCLQFYRNSMKTSMPQFRKNYLGLTKKLFERLRNIYEGLLTTTSKEQKKPVKKQYYTQFVDFLKQLVSICFESVFPETIFEIVNPALQILSLLQTYFGNSRVQVKKGIFLDPTQVLKSTSFYHFTNFQNLIACLQSSYESVRQLAHNLLNFFDEIQKKQLLLDLWEKSLQNTNKLAIRSYEYACRILTYISDVYPDILGIEKKYQTAELNILNFFLNLMRQRYGIFKDQFIKQGSNYYSNLVHGLLTIFSFQIEKLAKNVTNVELYKSKYAPAAKEIKQLFIQFFAQIINMLNFAVEISSSNVSTVVLDTVSQGSQTDKRLKVDCRGHFLNESTEKGSNIGTFLESTALISSMEDDEQGIQNTLVVSFYLLTREAGLVFQSVGELLATQNSSDYIPSQDLVKLINTYFYALVNLKHMGSVDRISKGLGKMARVIYDHQSKQLSQLPQNLLNKLLTHLKSGNFTNILRRSAGVPFAFCCLLKSESLKRSKLIEKSVTELLALSRDNKQNPIELRIHALNILKKIFQDSDLKGDLDPYVSEAFISSIKGFSSEQWGVRNSSLMLFTALSNRTIGVKPTYNLLQFFLKCPNLLEFIQSELNSFTEASLNSMYPPLYPIVLLFSRLLPFDLKQKYKVFAEGNMKNIRKQELLNLLPILDKAGLNHNYMGRVMTAKAILPFMQIDQILEYCVNGLLTLPQYFNKDNNKLHYELTKYYHLLTSYKQISKNSLRNLHIQTLTLEKFLTFLQLNIDSISNLICPVVLECFIKIIHYFFETFNSQIELQFTQRYSQVTEKILTMLNNITQKYVFATQKFVIKGDLGHSMMRKQTVSLTLDILTKFTDKFELFKNIAVKFTQFLHQKLQLNQNFFQTSDNQICQFYFEKILENMKSLKENQKIELFNSLTHLLSKLELDKIRSDIILSKVLQLRWSIGFNSSKNAEEVKFLLELQNQSDNHFLKISIFKYLDYIKISQGEVEKLLLKFSDPNSLQELRECAVEYLQTLTDFNPKLIIIYIRLLEDQEYEIRKESARIAAKQLKIYEFNETVIKNIILGGSNVSDIEKLILVNSDFKIKRKNHEEERIFSYDKPNKFRSDISSLFEVLTPQVLKHPKELSEVFISSLTQAESQLDVTSLYEQNIISRTQYHFELILRQLLSQIGSAQMDDQKLKTISNFHPLFAHLIQQIKTVQQ